MNLYCVEIVCAYPDYKRPYVSTRVYHFLTIEEANEKRREKKRKYYSDFLSALKGVEENEDETNNSPKDIDEVDEEQLSQFIYVDAYMDMEPFEATLYQISIDNGNITSEVIPFPPSESIEGI